MATIEDVFEAMIKALDSWPCLDEWFVAFVDYGHRLWWHRFTKRGFRHCFAFAFDPASNAWILFDPILQGFVLRAVTGDSIDRVIAEIWRVNGKVLRCPALHRGPMRPRLLATCVTVIAHLIGLPGCALRPDGLYRRLLRYGASPAFERPN